MTWPAATAADGVRKIRADRREIFGSNDSASVKDPVARQFLASEDERWNVQEDALFVIEGEITLDPSRSLATLPGRRIVTELQGVHPEVLPSLPAYAWHALSGRRADHYPELIHFDGFLGRNLWHFFSDAFNPLLFMQGVEEVPKDIPIVINKRIWDLPIARHLLGMEPFKARRWVVQDRQWIRTDRLYKASCALDHFRSAYGYTSARAPGTGRIFLNRREKYGRTIANIDEIEAITRAHGFETVFAEDLRFEQQVEWFANAGLIVGIHGAGLTNCLFSNVASLRCLEIQTASYLNPDYYWLLQLLGAERYDAIVGGELDRNHAFAVDPGSFSAQLGALCDAPLPATAAAGGDAK